MGSSVLPDASFANLSASSFCMYVCMYVCVSMYIYVCMYVMYVLCVSMYVCM